MVLDAKLIGVNLFGYGDRIKNVTMVNALGAGVTNNFSMLSVFDCLDHLSNVGKKDASYIASIFLTLIKKSEDMKDFHVSSSC